MVPDGMYDTADSFAVSNNHIVIGTSYEGRFAFFESAEVLTYARKSEAGSAEADD